MKALIVKEDGLIYAAEVPEFPYHFPKRRDYFSDAFYRTDIEKYEEMRSEYEQTLASAKESAILCADQEQAEAILDKVYNGAWRKNKPFDNPKPGIYPIPDLQWEVKEKHEILRYTSIVTGDLVPHVVYRQVAILKETLSDHIADVGKMVTPSTEQLKEDTEAATCVNCGVPSDLHGTICGWDAATMPSNEQGIITDSRHPGFGKPFMSWNRNQGNAVIQQPYMTEAMKATLADYPHVSPDNVDPCPKCDGAGELQPDVQCKRCEGTGIKDHDSLPSQEQKDIDPLPSVSSVVRKFERFIMPDTELKEDIDVTQLKESEDDLIAEIEDIVEGTYFHVSIYPESVIVTEKRGSSNSVVKQFTITRKP